MTALVATATTTYVTAIKLMTFLLTIRISFIPLSIIAVRFPLFKSNFKQKRGFAFLQYQYINIKKKMMEDIIKLS